MSPKFSKAFLAFILAFQLAIVIEARPQEEGPGIDATSADEDRAGNATETEGPTTSTTVAPSNETITETENEAANSTVGNNSTESQGGLGGSERAEVVNGTLVIGNATFVNGSRVDDDDFAVDDLLEAEDGPGVTSGSASESWSEPLIPYQDQIYIVSGTLGGILLLLILLVIALALSVAKLKGQVSKRHQRYVVTDDQNANNATNGTKKEQTLAYDNTGFNGQEMQERRIDSKRELEERGYTVYGGRSNENRPLSNRDSRSTLMRYEDGVVPITSDRPQVHRGGRDSGYRY